MDTGVRGARIEALFLALAVVFLGLGQGWGHTGRGFEPGTRAPDTLRVVTWNVGGVAGGVPHGFEGADLEHVAAVLAQLAPDLVLLQEIWQRSQLADLCQRLGPGWEPVRGGGDCAALARGLDERWRPPHAAPRAVGLWTRLAGRSLAVAALHASAFDAAERNREVGALLDALLSEDADGHLLAGDLNLDLDLDKRGDLFSNDMQRDVETYNYVAGRLTDAAIEAGPTAEPDRRLDYLFVSRELEVLSAGPWKGKRIGTMDHDPLVADLRWR